MALRVARGVPALLPALLPALMLALLCGSVNVAHGQVVTVRSLVQLGSEADERLRLGQLLNPGEPAQYLIRSASSLTRTDRTASPFGVTLVAPELRVVSNSALPFSLNDGLLWAGRGTNTLVTAGIGIRLGMLRILVAPQIATSENLPFQVIPYSQASSVQRSPWANPFHPPPSSIDLPYRFGDEGIRRVDPGQSSITLDLPGASVGVATENLWWGPGVRNAIVMSNNAAGFPHAFAQTRDGLHTPVGRFDAQWILGTLHESDFFDSNTANDLRSISGLAVIWTPRSDSGLSVGYARTVYAAAGRSGVPFTAAFDALRSVGVPNNVPATSVVRGGADQVFSLFGRWVLPRAGFETYVEWARFEQPISIRDFLEYPQHSQAYTLGLQWARGLARGGTLRVQAEATYLEPDPAQRVRPVATTYTSRVVSQGYTNRGKTIGAAIGPGSSSQWVTADLFGRWFRFGAFAERIRWDNATVWEPVVPEAKAEDLSLLGGVRGSVTFMGARLQLEYAHAVRLDYLYQDRVPDTNGKHVGVDIVNNTLALTLSTAVRR